MRQNEDTLHVQIAGFTIKIQFSKTELGYLKKRLQAEIIHWASSFILQNAPKKIDYTIEFVDGTQTDFLLRQNQGEHYLLFDKRKERKKVATFYHLSIFQFQLLLRNVLQNLLKTNNGFMLHASASEIRGEANLFLGPSEAGKTTTINLLREYFQPLTDDTAVIKKERGRFYFYQTPLVEREWDIKKSIQKYPIGRIFFLKKAKFFKLKRITNQVDIITSLTKQLWIAKKDAGVYLKKLLSFIINQGEFYFLYFAKSNKSLKELLER